MANNKRRGQYIWVKKPVNPTFDSTAKAKIMKQVQAFVSDTEKMRRVVSRMDMRGNRIYLYHLVEPFNPEGSVWIKPLIDDKYLEFPYARLTLMNTEATSCTADWQRHNDQWISLYQGTLDEVLRLIEDDNAWFGEGLR